ncbi:uncharacterized protein LOC143049014 [Mytilus galloprovincialis]|uniref:uncharacterized protein LOC143049014 n=1 Tax=Mytilus galloprovincialis TaxID=29158 RepID=UPI003F7C2178
MTNQPQQTEYRQYSTSHEAIQAILKAVEGNSFAQLVLQELRTKIYDIIGDDDYPYKCRLYIKELDFSYCIGNTEKCDNVLMININDNCKKYRWLNPNKSWYSRWFDLIPYYYKTKLLALENVK